VGRHALTPEQHVPEERGVQHESFVAEQRGLIALWNPQFQLRSTYGVENPAAIALFLTRHWGVLVLGLGCLILYSVYDPTIRGPVLIAAGAEKRSAGPRGGAGAVERRRAREARAVNLRTCRHFERERPIGQLLPT